MKFLKNYDQLQSQEIVCASAGNHAQGVALSYRTVSIKYQRENDLCPETTPPQKLKRIYHFGGEKFSLNNVAEILISVWR